MLRIQEIPVSLDDARALLGRLLRSDHPFADAAADRIRERLAEGGSVSLEAGEEDAVLAVLDDPPQGLVKLRTVLAREWEERIFGT
jgi:hypothetical protein